MKKQTKHLNPRYSAFTMAEILLSLTIIGVVAAITLPSLTGNINERTWATQKKALYSRFSQAIALMPTMNNYGTTLDNHAETFITNGLSKVLKINNICGPDDARFDCGFSSKITNGTSSKIDLPANIGALNAGIPETGIGGTAVAIKDTKAAAFETANGESILVFYNPNCTAGNVLIKNTLSSEGGLYAKQHVCANFVFDLNGKKGPNTFGKDIGVMTVVYSSDSKVVMPMQPRALSVDKKHEDAARECQNIDNGEYRLPNIEELMSIYYNRSVVGDNAFSTTNNHTWSSTSVDSDTAYTFGGTWGVKYPLPKDTDRGVVCVQR